MEKVQGIIKNYDWGGYDLYELLGVDGATGVSADVGSSEGMGSQGAGAGASEGGEAAHGAPFAEYWLGADLPFLLKMLSAKKPLSIQVHPNKAQAKEGFARENTLGIDIAASNRTYKDQSDKPEMIIALGDFYAVAGFDTPENIVAFCRAVAAAAKVRIDSAGAAGSANSAGSENPASPENPAEKIVSIFEEGECECGEGTSECDSRECGTSGESAESGAPDVPGALGAPDTLGKSDKYKAALRYVVAKDTPMINAQDVQNADFEGLRLPGSNTGSYGISPEQKEYLALKKQIVLNGIKNYPNDTTVLSLALLNAIKLKHGEAVFLDAGTLHSYQAGTGIEIMNPSDNVVRAGLTSKHIDIDELFNIVDFSKTDFTKINPTVVESPGAYGFTLYDVQNAEANFGVAVGEIKTEADLQELGLTKRASVVLCLEGEAKLAAAPNPHSEGAKVPSQESEQQHIILKKGQSALLESGEQVVVKSVSEANAAKIVMGY